ncbi:hypothetical protein ACFFON_18150 [Arthrobacter citreus]|uniref:hypothetical protein n=1 Tax=Arthrobacter TaxID=1663 RepID=UPI001264820D|nr:hypothetical protein [Arthrobacter gandavensis]
MNFGLAEFEQRLPDPDAIRTHAAETMDIGERAQEIMNSVGGTWLKLTAPEIYEVQGNEKVFTVLDTSIAKMEALTTSTIQIDTLMRAYADSVDWLKVRMQGIKVRVSDFNRDYPESEKDEWDNDAAVVATRNTLASDVGRLHSDLDEAQRETAARITHITGSDRTYGETGKGLDTEVIAYGFGYSDYAAAFSGGYLSTDLPWWRDTMNFLADTREGVPQAAWEFVTGLGVLIGFQGWGKAGSAWTGMYRTGENIVILGTGVAGPQRRQQALDEMTLLGQDLIRMDQWQSDRPGLALGGNIFDIGSLFIGGAGAAGGAAKAGAKAGAGAGVKAGSAAGHLGRKSFPLKPSPADWPEARKLIPPLLEGGPLPVTPQPLPENTTARREGKGSAGGKPFSSTYSPHGRDPARQPQVGDADGGNGSFQDVEPRSIHGAPEQQYITGIDRVHDTQAREYVLLKRDGTEVAFDGHDWRGDPPKEYFTEVKGHLDFLDSIKPDLLAIRLEGMIQKELRGQIEALEHSAAPGYLHEWVFTEKVVMDTFERVMRRYPQLRGRISVRFEPMP